MHQQQYLCLNPDSSCSTGHNSALKSCDKVRSDLFSLFLFSKPEKVTGSGSGVSAATSTLDAGTGTGVAEKELSRRNTGSGGSGGDGGSSTGIKCMKCQKGFLSNMSRQRHQRICPGKRGVPNKHTALSEQHKRQLKEWVDALLCDDSGKELIQQLLRKAWEDLDERYGVEELWNALDDVFEVSEEASKKYITSGNLLRKMCLGQPSDLTTYTALEQFLVYCSEGTYQLGENLLAGGVKWESGDVDINELPGLLAAQVEHNLWMHYMEAKTKEVNELQQKLMAEENSKGLVNSKSSKLSPTKPSKKKKRAPSKTKLVTGSTSAGEVYDSSYLSDNDQVHHESSTVPASEPEPVEVVTVITEPKSPTHSHPRSRPQSTDENHSLQTNAHNSDQYNYGSQSRWENSGYTTQSYGRGGGKYWGSGREGGPRERGGRGPYPYRGGRGMGRSSQGYYWSGSGSGKICSVNSGGYSNSNSYYNDGSDYAYRRRTSTVEVTRHPRDQGSQVGRGTYSKKWVQSSPWKQRKPIESDESKQYPVADQHVKKTQQEVDMEVDNPFKAFKQPNSQPAQTTNSHISGKPQTHDSIQRIQSSPRSLVGGNQEQMSPRNNSVSVSDPSVTPRSQLQRQSVSQRLSYASILSRTVQGGQDSVTDSTEQDQPEMFPELVRHVPESSQGSLLEPKQVSSVDNVQNFVQCSDNDVTQEVAYKQPSPFASQQEEEFQTQNNPLFAPPPPDPACSPMQEGILSNAVSVDQMQNLGQMAASPNVVLSPQLVGTEETTEEGLQLMQKPQGQMQQQQQQSQPIRYPIPLNGVQPGMVPPQQTISVPLSFKQDFVPPDSAAQIGLPIYPQNQQAPGQDWSLLHLPPPHLLPPRGNILLPPHLHPHPHPHLPPALSMIPPPAGFAYKDQPAPFPAAPFPPFPHYPEFHPNVVRVEQSTQVSDIDTPKEQHQYDDSVDSKKHVEYRDESMQTDSGTVVEHDEHVVYADDIDVEPECAECVGWFEMCVRKKLQEKCEQEDEQGQGQEYDSDQGQGQECDSDQGQDLVQMQHEQGSQITSCDDNQASVFFKDDQGSVLDPSSVQDWLIQRLRASRNKQYENNNVANSTQPNRTSHTRLDASAASFVCNVQTIPNQFYDPSFNMNNAISHPQQEGMDEEQYLFDYYYENDGDENQQDESVMANGHHYYENMVYNAQPQYNGYGTWIHNDKDYKQGMSQQQQQQWQNYHQIPSYVHSSQYMRKGGGLKGGFAGYASRPRMNGDISARKMMKWVPKQAQG